MSQIQYRCSDLVFHFNKKHLEDPTVPMWVLKSAGVTFYVNHVEAEIPWNTKETPDNSHTKGSIKFKKCKLTINDNNEATVSKLSLFDYSLPKPKIVHARIITRISSIFAKALRDNEFKHSKIKEISGSCGSGFIVCDLLDKNEVLIAAIKYATEFRTMTPNEVYYKLYDEKSDWIPEQDDDDIDPIV